MISPRRRRVNPMLLAISTWPAISTEQPLTPREIMTLITVYCIQTETNGFPTLAQITSRMKIGYGNAKAITSRLSVSGFIESIDGAGMYNVTNAGEYYIRGLVTSISRIVNESRMSRWERPGDNELRSRYKRKSTRHGT